METLGFTSPKQLTEARRKAIESGWLHYERPGTRSVGHYWVTIPSNVTEFSDAPIEEADETLSAGGTNQEGIHSAAGKNQGTILSAGGMNCGTNPGTNCGKLSIPVPAPNPKEGSATASPSVKRFQKPTLTEITDYCRERSNTVDAEAFLDFYESKGWKVGSAPMKDWRAAVRNWERRSKAGSNGKPSATKSDEIMDQHTREAVERLQAGKDEREARRKAREGQL